MSLELDGVNGIIKNTTSDGDVTIKGNDGGSEISALTLDMSDAGAATFNGTAIMDGNSWHKTNKIAYFGDGNNLQISSDGTHGKIAESGGSGNLVLSGQTIRLEKSDGEIMIEATNDAGVDIRHNHITKLATTSTGIDITGGFAATAASTITSSSAGDLLTLKSTNAGAEAGPNLVLFRDSASPANDDVIGRIRFEGDDNEGNKTVYAQLTSQIIDKGSSGGEDSTFQMEVFNNGALRNIMHVKGATNGLPEVVFNESSQDVNFRIESDGNDNMLFVDGGNNSVHIGSGTVESSDVFAVYSSGTSTPVRIVNTNANSVAPSVIFQKNSSSPADDDEIGLINFIGQDDAGNANVYAQMVVVSTDVSNGSENGKIQFGNVNNGSYSIKLEIDSSGQVLCGDTLTAQNGQKLHSSRNDKAVSFGAENLHASLDGAICVAEISANATSSAGYRLLRGVSGNGSGSSFVDNEFIFQGNGDLSVDGSVGTGGADYAEMFEWKDGNSSSEDRRGYSVILDGNQIVKATDSDDTSKIIGIVSAMPVVIGDSDIDDKWKSKYLKDDFGNYIMEEYTSTEWVEVIEDKDEEDKVINKRNIVQSYASDRIPSEVTVPSDATVRVVDADGNKFTRKKLNPDWDDSKTYVRRKDRKEWDAIGLMGKLRLRKGQPTGTNWIKMRDISDTVEEWLVR